MQDLLGKVSQTSGLSTHGGTVLGRVLNYSDKDLDILDNVSHLLAMSDSRDKGKFVHSLKHRRIRRINTLQLIKFHVNAKNPIIHLH